MNVNEYIEIEIERSQIEKSEQKAKNMFSRKLQSQIVNIKNEESKYEL
jgi:hypothetical protein